MDAVCLAAAVVAPDAMLDLWRIRRRKTLTSIEAQGGDSEGAVETLNCAICLGSIQNFVSASCMSCVCEGIFHTECLELLSTVTPHMQHADQRQCPYCRTVGTIVELHKEVHRMCPPSSKREFVEKKVRRMWVLPPSTRDSLEESERTIAKRSRLLGEQLNALQCLYGGNGVCEGLLHPPPSHVAKTPAGSTLCRKCGQGIMDFSDLATQGCHCKALYHSKCLKEVVGGTPIEKIPCCLSCRSVGIVPEGVSVKELVAASCVSPRTPPLKEALKEAADIKDQQARCLTRLAGHLKTVAAVTAGLKKRDAAPSANLGSQKRQRTRLAYLPP